MKRSVDEAPRMGHRAVIPPTVNPPVDRVPDALLRRFRDVWVPDVSDAVGPFYTMDPMIRPFYTPSPRLLGQALTVKVPPGDNLAIHGAMTMVRPGDVLVIDWRGYVDGCGAGAQSLIGPMRGGLRGLVIDGAWRDIGELKSMRLPLFARCASAFSPPKDRPGEVNVPISCGGVVVCPGDIIVGDEEGVVVVPRTWAERVIDSVSEYQGPTPVASVPEDHLKEQQATRQLRFKMIVEDYGGSVPAID